MPATHFTSDDVAPAVVTAALARAGFEIGRAQAVRRTLLDTFDGALRAAGLRLELREQSGHELLLTGGGSVPARVAAAGLPRLAGDLPAGPFRSRLAGVLGIRALLPVLSVTAREIPATSTDGTGKARARVTVHAEVTVAGRAGVPTTWSASVAELTGYAKDGAEARALLSKIGLQPGDGDPLDMAAARAGVDLRGFDSSPTIALRRKEPALEAFRQVLAHLAGAVEANRPGTVDDVDPEFLHDLRVAVRRTRSVLAQGRGVLPADVRDRYRDGFGWLGTATGRARDLDVYVIEWGGYLGPLEPAAAAELAPVHAHIAGLRRAEHAVLADVLRSPRHQELMTTWQAWLQAPVPAAEEREAQRPIGKVATHRTARAQDRLVARGRAIGAATPAEELHELRKDAKKLRYLLECFGGLYDAGLRRVFVQRLKALQDNLGEHQDAEVHAGELRAISYELHDAPGVGPATLVAMGQLTEHLERRRRAARADFAQRFAAYDTRQTRRTFEELLGSAGSPTK